MRFVVTGEWDRNHLLRLILGLFLIYVALFWVTNWILYFQKMDLTPASIVEYYRGDPAAEFGQPPRPLGAIAEVSHYHLFAMGMLVMTLTHLLLFLPVAIKTKAILVSVTFATALMSESGSWLVRYVHPAFAWWKLFGFLAMQLAMFGLVVALFVGVCRPARNAYTDSAAPRNKA